MLHISECVVKRRLRQFGLSRRQKYSNMTNDELDGYVQQITDGNPHLGQRNVLGQLSAVGHTVQRHRVADSLARVDAPAVAMRWSRTIQRRSYQVAGPNSLWHIDGNHKFIRWGIVIHGGIDGFSRLIVFLKAVDNNQAATVLDAFLPATEEYGIPSRVRCDHGVENLDVATFIEMYRGLNRGSVLTGRSVHNQRIERFWRDLYMGCSNVYKAFFETLENAGDLDPDNVVYVWCLQYVYLPRLNKDIQRFADGWNHHRLSSEGGRTPLQMFVQGAVNTRGQGHTAIDELFAEAEDSDTEWRGPADTTPFTAVMDIRSPINAEQLEQLGQAIDPLRHSSSFGRDIYMEVREFVR